jgi:hypothetical protein
MAFVPTWERLDEACKRVVGAGLPEPEAQRDICRAMASGEIRVRPRLALIKETVLDHKVHNRYAHQIAKFADDLFDGINRYPKPWEMHNPFSMPRQLESGDLDWRGSCFKMPFSIAIRPDIAPMRWHVSIELFSADVTRTLIASGIAALSAKGKTSQRISAPRRARATPTRDRARKALEAVYGRDVPDQTTEPNTILCRKVGAKLKELNLGSVSDDTILRVANRRKSDKGPTRHG